MQRGIITRNMFESLSQRITSALKALTQKGILTEQDVTAALREIRIALLEADVALPAVKSFIELVRTKALGKEVIETIAPGQLVTKIVYDELVTLLGKETVPLNLNARAPAVILMLGLQGSGKTTSSVKLARYIQEKLRKTAWVASLDVYRPAAQEQLEIFAKESNVSSVPILPQEKPLEILARALEVTARQGADVLILDTAGRLHIDEPLMDELVAIKDKAQPIETLLVLDAMTGQDAAEIGLVFQKKMTLTGVVLTRLDGDARGGAALSIRHVTHAPIKFMGVGEKVGCLEPFHPERIAQRILDKGDVVSLVEKAIETIDKQDAERLNKRIESGSFDLNDMAMQIHQMVKMGGMSGILTMLPGMGSLKEKLSGHVNDNTLKRQIAIIRSMTSFERKSHKVLNASRKRRIAIGSGTTVQEVNRLLKQFEGTLGMMKKVKKMGKRNFLTNGLNGLFK